MPDTVSIAVRPLVEYAFLSGSLDDRFRTATSLTEGTKAHQRVQSQYGELDQKEVYMRAEIPCGNLLFAVDGRCDGLLFADEGYIIEEIKSTRGDLAAIAEETYPVHWAQAYCYAYMYAKANGLERMRVRLTYVQVETGEDRRYERAVPFAELERLLADVVEKYAPYARMLHAHRRARDESIAELAFPFERYRAGQRRLAGAVFRSIEAGHSLFARAPTGIGKTMSTLYPAVKAIGQGTLQHLFYLTARTTTRTAAEEAIARMRDRGLRMHAVTITAKEKICFQDEVACSPDRCPFADGYYDRVNGAVLNMLTEETTMSREVIERYARKHRVCPFEFSLDAAYAADAIICDYNYVFDPRISLKRLAGERKADTALLVDEAHNLVDRAREMYSAVLKKRGFLEVQRAYKGVNASVHQAAKAVNAAFISLRKSIGDAGTLLLDGEPEALAAAVEAFIAAAERELAGGGARAETPLLLDAFFAAANWVRIGKLYDERYVTYAEIGRGGDVRIKLFCLDPSHLLRQMRKGYRSQVCFSATLSPLNFYMDMLGAEEEDYTISIPSPFDRAQWEVAILPVSTRFRDRERSIAPIVRRLAELIGRRPGNYLFFFPSYAYMNEVYGAFTAEAPDVRTLLQTAEMPEAERDRFLAAFDAENRETLAGFAVMGGVFSEGVDLVGDRLQGVVVVGVGMPQLGLERNLIKAHFDARGMNGFDYAYVYPGMNKVLQAGGRLIRSEQDRGVLVLVDDRYLQQPYRSLLPEEWRREEHE
ncbi:helicase C-terminal domain-containing protein [Cohnella nanjingensis]|uniref:ATP-dependent DNA helicase n=1 Tax=Cohnella nanjingensis TaxID=1387779 RepID=A0A7X0VIR9_9BACL|nr:helicase C-terminal domain-containing protein [Cohnella nanjingensis]MBB6675221.1 ATP-dependent DNA helicase [Cohnella nanjingensis]